MDLSTLMGTILSSESLAGMSQKAEASEDEVRSVLGNALPLLLNGANAQATNASTAASFAGALQQHSASDISNLGSFLGNVDMDDGAKIIAHLLGANTASQTQYLSQQTGVSNATTSNILSTAAPLLMSLLGQQNNTQTYNNGAAGMMSSLLGSGDMTSILGSLLGANAAPVQTYTAPVQQKPSGLGGLLAKLLGLR